MKNYCDLLVPVAFPGCKNVYEPLEWAKKIVIVISQMMRYKRMVIIIIGFTSVKNEI